MKKFLVILLVIFALLIGGIYYLLQPKTLGIKYTAEDLSSFNDKIKVKNEALPADTPLGQTLVVSGSHPVDQSFNSHELTAAVENRHNVYSYFPFRNVQIRVNKDGSVEGSGSVSLKDGVNYLLALGVSSADIEKGVEKFKIPNADLPVYLKVSGNIIKNESRINVLSAKIANISVPQNLIKQYGPGLNVLVDAVIKKRQPSYNFEKLEVVDGNVIFKGNAPDIEKTIRGK